MIKFDCFFISQAMKSGIINHLKYICILEFNKIKMYICHLLFLKLYK